MLAKPWYRRVWTSGRSAAFESAKAAQGEVCPFRDHVDFLLGYCIGHFLACADIMRPECVQDLTPPRYRTTQNVSVQQLKQALLSVPADGLYDYQHTWGPVSDSGRPILRAGFDLARDLL